ncbi:hypothetical protein D3Y57_07035 [Sphingomonas paeninsulae]|uniref:Uncharacterized protein n=1 Tax=Sphingomonas paeninsulae TaxID=2319844 RepID=A0A494TES2_SPHPE|nr:hypothetical protein [Sphingomonas paeninsulae]AYJ85772.1 hypothetical protein D3Y57_07035 [Sphingomonas paeninsulae]
MSIRDEVFTDEETAALATLELDNTPPVDENDPVTTTEAIDPALAAATPAAPADPATPAPVDEDAAFKAWQEANKGKTPDELARIAFNQTKRADRVSFDHRRVTTQSAELASRAREQLASRKSSIAERRAAFATELNDDPDAATKRLADERFDAEERAAEAEVTQIERQAQLDSAIDLASRAIPDFATAFPKIREFGAELNYSPEEVDGISDGRDVVTLYLAMLSANMIKAGAMDMRGQMVSATPPSVAATDPRLNTPATPGTMTAGAGRATDGVKSVEEQLGDLLNLSDADFNKLDTETLRRLTGNA